MCAVGHDSAQHLAGFSPDLHAGFFRVLPCDLYTLPFKFHIHIRQLPFGIGGQILVHRNLDV